MNPNDHAIDLLQKATANGWVLTEYSIETPGYVVLVDRRGSRVEIRSEYGLDIPYYVEAFKARPEIER